MPNKPSQLMLMSWEQARMKLIDGQGVTHPEMSPHYLLLRREALVLMPAGSNYEPSKKDLKREDWVML